MAYATQSLRHEGIAARVGILMNSMSDALARRRVYKTTLAELGALSGRELADLGLHRAMIRRVAYEAAYGA
jgi:uncharacterized protein YjiS (DUF1127 family)